MIILSCKQHLGMGQRTTYRLNANHPPRINFKLINNIKDSIQT